MESARKVSLGNFELSSGGVVRSLRDGRVKYK